LTYVPLYQKKKQLICFSAFKFDPQHNLKFLNYLFVIYKLKIILKSWFVSQLGSCYLFITWLTCIPFCD